MFFFKQKALSLRYVFMLHIRTYQTTGGGGILLGKWPGVCDKSPDPVPCRIQNAPKAYPVA